jgi:hypothetical protein
LVEIEKRRHFPIPHAWLGQRLVKVVPTLFDSGDERYPAATSPVEQWQLVVQVAAQEVSRLQGQGAYWRRK